MLVIYKKSTKLTYPPDWYSNQFLNACINRQVHAEYLKMIEFYSPFGMRHVFLYSINTNKTENTYQIHCLQTGRRHFIPCVNYGFIAFKVDIIQSKITLLSLKLLQCYRFLQKVLCNVTWSYHIYCMTSTE